MNAANCIETSQDSPPLVIDCGGRTFGSPATVLVLYFPSYPVTLPGASQEKLMTWPGVVKERFVETAGTPPSAYGWLVMWSAGKFCHLKMDTQRGILQQRQRARTDSIWGLLVGHDLMYGDRSVQAYDWGIPVSNP